MSRARLAALIDRGGRELPIAAQWSAGTVEVPAGKIRAIRLERDDGPNRGVTTYWFAPAMGCIKWSSNGNGREMTAFKSGK